MSTSSTSHVHLLLSEALEKLALAEQAATTATEQGLVFEMRKKVAGTIGRAADDAARLSEGQGLPQVFRLDGKFGILMDEELPAKYDGRQCEHDRLYDQLRISRGLGDGWVPVETGEAVERDFTHALHKELRQALASQRVYPPKFNPLPVVLRSVNGVNKYVWLGDGFYEFFGFDGKFGTVDECERTLDFPRGLVRNQANKDYGKIWDDRESLDSEAPEGTRVSIVTGNQELFLTKVAEGWEWDDGEFVFTLPKSDAENGYTLHNWGWE